MPDVSGGDEVWRHGPGPVPWVVSLEGDEEVDAEDPCQHAADDAGGDEGQDAGERRATEAQVQRGTDGQDRRHQGPEVHEPDEDPANTPEEAKDHEDARAARVTKCTEDALDAAGRCRGSGDTGTDEVNDGRGDDPAEERQDDAAEQTVRAVDDAAQAGGDGDGGHDDGRV